MTTTAKPQFTFEQEFLAAFRGEYPIIPTFIDFITLCICALSMTDRAGKSYYDEIYQKTIKKYKSKGDAIRFPLLYGKLVREMDKRAGSRSGNDVLGEFFENHINPTGNPRFIPSWHTCSNMAAIYKANSSYEQRLEQRRILDPACTTGRLLIAGARELGIYNHYFGIDTNVICTRIAAINLFLNEIYTGEVMCANAFNPEDTFVESYMLYFNPMRIYRVTQQDQSPLWRWLALRPFRPKIDMDAHYLNEMANKGKGSELSIF